MQAPQDYFSLFSLERRFAIDKKALPARFRDLQSESHPNHSNDPSSALREAVKFNAGVDRAAANQHRFQVRRDRRLRVQRFVIKFTTLRFGVAVEERVSGFSVARDVVLRENQNARIGSRRPSADWC